MLSQRLRRFRVEGVVAKWSSRSVRIQAPTFHALNTHYISSNVTQFQSYTTSPYHASRGSTAVKQKEETHAASKSGESAALSNSGYTATADGTDLATYFPEYFYNPSNQNAFDIRSGTYMDLDEKDILRYFPEGFAGEANDEFEYTNKKRWMIRDSTKVLFRLIEETEKQLKYDAQEVLDKNFSKPKVTSDLLSSDPIAPSSTKVEGVGIHSAVKIPRLNGQAEWPDSQLRVSYFGKDLFPTSEVESVEFEGFVKTKGPGSPVEQTVDALHAAVKKDKKDSIPDRIVLSGGRGHGKSMLLNQAVMFARQRGWLVVFVPNGWDHVQSGPYIQPLTVKVDGENKVVYDNPYMNKVLLRGLWKAHHKQLKKIVIEDIEALLKYEPLIQSTKKALINAMSLPGREKLGFVELRKLIASGGNYLEEYDALDAEALKNYDLLKAKIITLEDLVLLGLAIDDLSGYVVQDVVRNLREQTQIPVMFAVDQYNTWFAPSAFAYEEAGRLTGLKLNVPSALHFLDTKKRDSATSQWTVKHGLCIAATSFKHSKTSKNTENVRFDTDLALSMPLRIRVNSYSHQEYVAAMSYYVQPGVSPLCAALNWDDVFMFRMLTNSIPRLLRAHGASYFLPRNVRSMEQDLQMAALLGMSDPTKVVRTEDFDRTLGFKEEETTMDFATFASSRGGKVDSRFFAPPEEDTEEEEFLEHIERTEEDEYYSDEATTDDNDDLKLPTKSSN